MNPNIPDQCNACRKLLLLENLFVDDGCPCNSPRGINFQPKPCAICKTDDCVKPGHRQTALFGVPRASPTADEIYTLLAAAPMAQGINSLAARISAEDRTNLLLSIMEAFSMGVDYASEK